MREDWNIWTLFEIREFILCEALKGQREYVFRGIVEED